MPFYHRPPADRGPLRPRSPMALGQAAATPTPAELAEAAEVGYAVVDLETTGLSPTTDSILEVALVLTDAAGRVERSWSTLIDPGAGVDVGPTHIHGLVAEELIGAPGFDEVADLLVADLAGRRSWPTTPVSTSDSSPRHWGRGGCSTGARGCRGCARWSGRAIS